MNLLCFHPLYHSNCSCWCFPESNLSRIASVYSTDRLSKSISLLDGRWAQSRAAGRGLLSRRNRKSGYAIAFSLVLGNHDSWPFLPLRLWRWFIRWGAASTERRTADDLKGVRGGQRASQRQHFAHIRSVKPQYRFLSKRSRLHRCAARGFGGGDAQWTNGPLRRRDNCGERRIEQRQPNGCHADSKLIVQLRRERY
jgi:hypothetical protein